MRAVGSVGTRPAVAVGFVLALLGSACANTSGTVSTPRNTRPEPVTTADPADAPVIDVWYGDRQVFGARGQPQRWVNILGNVSDPDGVRLLTYTLNDGRARTLGFGPDGRRLQDPGDFNLELPFDDYEAGVNEVELRAQDTLGNIATRRLTVEVSSGNSWPLPYRTDWLQAATVTDQVQPVDGRWAVEGDTARAVALGYDRLFTLGDLGWVDYEVEIPLTVHSVRAETAGPSGAPLVGLALRWQGHTAKKNESPGVNPNPLGALAWLRWAAKPRFELTGNDGSPKVVAAAQEPLVGVPYVFKARVQTVGGETRYAFKAWPRSQGEPGAWLLEIVAGSGPASGGVGVYAHHADVSFGNIAVTPLGP